MTPTLFSVSYAGFWGQYTLDAASFVRKAGQLGYRAVELVGKRPHLSVVDTTDDEIEDLRAAAKEAGVEIATVAGYTDFTSGQSSAEVPFVEMQVAYIRSLAELARRLDGKIVRVFTGYTTDPDGHQTDWDRCVTAVRECAAVAETFGITLGVQNHHDVGVGVQAFGEFLSDVDHPNCRAMFDPWSIALQGSDLRAAAKQFAPLMVQTTLADYIRLPRFQYLPKMVNYRPLIDAVRAVPLGEGFLDLAGFFKGLTEGGFAGYVAYEMCSPLRGGGSEANLDAAARASLAKIRAWAEAGHLSSRCPDPAG